MLKVKRFLAVGKRDGGFDPPGFVFRCVGTLPGIMRFDAGFQVFGEAGIEPFGVSF